jgi:hypothetical protein
MVEVAERSHPSQDFMLIAYRVVTKPPAGIELLTRLIFTRRHMQPLCILPNSLPIFLFYRIVPCSFICWHVGYGTTSVFPLLDRSTASLEPLQAGSKVLSLAEIFTVTSISILPIIALWQCSCFLCGTSMPTSRFFSSHTVPRNILTSTSTCHSEPIL